MKERCRHERHSWLIADGYYEWCFVCGAFRSMKQVSGENAVTPSSKWCKPTGDKNNNPFNKWKDTK